MSWNTDDMTNQALRMYEGRARAAEIGDSGMDMSLPDDDDGIDDDGVDTLTGQSILSSWEKTQPWAQDEPGVKVADASGYGEAALTMGTGIAASIPAGLAGLGELARGNGMTEAVKTIEGIQQWLTVLPKTPEGKKALEQLVPLLEKLSIPAQAVGGAVLDATGSPAAATAAEIVLDPLNAVIPAGAVAVKAGVKGVAKVASRVAELPMNVAGGTPKAQLGAITYHGSPHKFDKFDMSKIGTGEGAQAYGHGLYFSDAPEVAKAYQKNLSSKYPVSHSGVIEEEGKHLAWAKRTDGESAEVIHTGATKKEAQKALKQYMADKRGALYKVDIPDETIAKMLDWDKPLSEQSKEVQSLLKASKIEFDNVNGGFGSPNLTGEDLMMRLSGNVRSSKATSSYLKQLGIPGIRYLDGNSRGAGGTSNYVLFDDKDATILEKNGKPTGAKPSPSKSPEKVKK